MKTTPAPSIEAYLTLGQAAEVLGVKTWQLQRAAKAGLFPSYVVGSGRRRVKLTEVVAAIEATRKGGPIDG